MMMEKQLQEKVEKKEVDVSLLSLQERGASKEDLPSMYILNTLAKHYSPDVLRDKKVLKENTFRGKMAVLKGYLYINIYNLFAFAIMMDVIIRCINTGLIVSDMSSATVLILMSVFMFFVTAKVTLKNNKTNFSFLSRLWASDYYKNKFAFFKDFNLDISKPISKDLAKVIDFMVWSEKFLELNYPKEGTLIDKNTRKIINKYKSIVFDDDKMALASLNEFVIVNDILSVNDGLVAISKRDFLPEGRFYDIAKKYSSKREVELSKLKVKSGLVLDKYEEQSNVRLLDLIGKSDI